MLAYLNRLWKYNITENKWEFVYGNKSADVFANENPSLIGSGYRHDMAIDGNGDIFVFGGQFYRYDLIKSLC